MTVIPGLINDDLDDILRIREDIGADLAQVRIMTRTWSGDEVGEGTATEVYVEMDPSPGFGDLSHSYKVASGGAFQQGDKILKMISKNQYPTKADVDCSSANPLVEKFYEVNGDLYRVITVVEKYVYWDVQVRKLTDQTRRA